MAKYVHVECFQRLNTGMISGSVTVIIELLKTTPEWEPDSQADGKERWACGWPTSTPCLVSQRVLLQEKFFQPSTSYFDLLTVPDSPFLRERLHCSDSKGIHKHVSLRVLKEFVS